MLTQYEQFLTKEVQGLFYVFCFAVDQFDFFFCGRWSDFIWSINLALLGNCEPMIDLLSLLLKEAYFCLHEVANTHVAAMQVA